jgi:tetratricopeptide (TPR) repeat protein
MLSPRAAPLGYPWQDTLAHELTHLAVTRATRDHAPLWLQEGLAKHEETRWRKQRPFDGEPDPSRVARTALEQGESVGIDQLGASIAMLPTPRAASIAFSEVQSFVEYFLGERGPAALALLLMDLKGLKPDEASGALRSVTGYDLSQWIVLWQTALASSEELAEPAPVVSTPPLVEPRLLARSVRLGDLLLDRAELVQAERTYREALDQDSRQAALRWRLGRALVALGREDEASRLLESADSVADNHAGWHALRGRFMKRAGRAAEAEGAFALAIALNPYLEDAACEGWFRVERQKSAPLPEDPARRALCEAARKIARE